MIARRGGALELEQIQGLMLNGYRHHTAARYAMFEILDASRARRWIAGLSGSLQYGDYRRTGRDEPPFLRNVCLNLAFTHPGFQALALHPIALRGFSLPFQEGLAEPSRARRLGDDGPSDPSRWAWGRTDRPVHGLLAVFGTRCTPEHPLGATMVSSEGACAAYYRYRREPTPAAA